MSKYSSPVKQDLFSTKPIAPFKMIDLDELKNDQSLRDRLHQYNPFDVMHNQGVKKQLFLLFQVFNSIKKRDNFMDKNESKDQNQEEDVFQDGSQSTSPKNEEAETIIPLNSKKNNERIKTNKGEGLSRNQGIIERRAVTLTQGVKFEDQKHFYKQKTQQSQQTIAPEGTLMHQRQEKFMEASLMLKQLMQDNEKSRIHLQSLRKLSSQLNFKLKIKENDQQKKNNIQQLIDKQRNLKNKATIERQLASHTQEYQQNIPSKSLNNARNYPKFMKPENLTQQTIRNELSGQSENLRKNIRLKHNPISQQKRHISQSRNKFIAHQTFININQQRLVDKPDVYMNRDNQTRFLLQQRIDPTAVQSPSQNAVNALFSMKDSTQYTNEEIQGYLQNFNNKRKSTYESLDLRGSFSVLNNSQIDTPKLSLRKLALQLQNKTLKEQRHVSPAIKEYIDTQISNTLYNTQHPSRKEYFLNYGQPSIISDSEIKSIYIDGNSNIKEHLKNSKIKTNQAAHTNRLNLRKNYFQQSNTPLRHFSTSTKLIN